MGNGRVSQRTRETCAVDSVCMTTKHEVAEVIRNPVTNRIVVVCTCGHAVNAEGRTAARQAHADHAARG